MRIKCEPNTKGDNNSTHEKPERWIYGTVTTTTNHTHKYTHRTYTWNRNRLRSRAQKKELPKTIDYCDFVSLVFEFFFILVVLCFVCIGIENQTEIIWMNRPRKCESAHALSRSLILDCLNLLCIKILYPTHFFYEETNTRPFYEHTRAHKQKHTQPIQWIKENKLKKKKKMKMKNENKRV